MMSVGTVVICPIPTFSRPNKKGENNITLQIQLRYLRKLLASHNGQTKLSGVSGGFSLIRHMGRWGSKVFQEG